MKKPITIQKRMLLYGRKFGVLAGVAAISCGVTYLVCNQAYEARTAELQEQISDLQKKELQAKVTQRVSEQMEDIAFQQKNISDKQREEAVRQSRIADMERGKAEIERGFAQQAQKKAVLAAEQADQMRIMAVDQKEIATKNMMEAEKLIHCSICQWETLWRSQPSPREVWLRTYHVFSHMPHGTIPNSMVVMRIPTTYIRLFYILLIPPRNLIQHLRVM